MRVLVTGGAGFIGSAVCRHFVGECGASVLNVDKLTSTASLASLSTIASSPRYTLRKADVSDRARMSALMQAFEPDAVVHLAAAGPDARTETLIESNVCGTIHVLEAAHDYWTGLAAPRRDRFRLLHVSAAAAGGAHPATPHAASKSAAEQFAVTWHRSSGLPVLISRAAATYGPYQFPHQPIPKAILAAMDGEAASLAGAGQASEWLFVEDHVRALELILAKGTPGATYDIGSGATRPAEVVSARICELVERHARKAATGKARLRGIKEAPAGSGTAAIDASKLERETGWRPVESFESGLSKAVRWYLDNPAWWGPLRDARLAGDRQGLLRIA